MVEVFMGIYTVHVHSLQSSPSQSLSDQPCLTIRAFLVKKTDVPVSFPHLQTSDTDREQIWCFDKLVASST